MKNKNKDTTVDTRNSNGQGLYITQAQQTKNLSTLWGTYYPGFAFEEWVIEYSKTAIYLDDCKATEIYICGTENNINIDRLINERVPVNMTWQPHYDKAGLKKAFGWNKSYYTTYYNTNETLAPNIAIFCKSPIDGNYGENDPRVNILSVIGYAFDSEEQPDYKVLVDKKKPDKSATEEELKKRYYKIFEKIYQCCIDHNFKCIIMSQFGTTSFATFYPGIIEIWKVAFKKSLEAWKEKLKNAELEYITFCGKREPDEDLVEIVKKAGFKYIAIPGEESDPANNKRLVPNIWSEPHIPGSNNEVLLKDAFLVNAWDPHSIIGNGNARDESLDGHVGRHTAVSALGWPLSNTYMNRDNVIHSVDSKLK